MTTTTPERDAPMPDGVKAMTKQQLWNWLQRSQRAAAETLALREKFFVTTTGLHSSRSHLIGDPSTTIEEQRKRIKGLEQQMGEMQKGYDKKLRKAVAQVQASEKRALAALARARLIVAGGAQDEPIAQDLLEQVRQALAAPDENAASLAKPHTDEQARPTDSGDHPTGA